MDVINDITFKNVSADCKPSVFGIGAQRDRLINFSHNLRASTVYGIVSSQGAGAWALSYILAGRKQPDSGEIYLNKTLVQEIKTLKQQSCYVGENVYNRNLIGIKTYPAISRLLSENVVRSAGAIQSIIDELEISPTRMERSLQHVSNERWNASVAIGLAQGKSIFCFPSLNKEWKNIIKVRLRTCSDVLRRKGCITMIPSNDASIISEIADEMITIDDNKYVEC